MRRVLRWTSYLMVGTAAFGVLAAALVWVLSERTLRKTWDVSSASIAVPMDSATIAEGGRLARIRGCWDGCHGRGASGEVFFDEPGVARVIAPDLTRVVHTLSNSELERVIRHGVRADGRSVMIMPANTFRHLDDAELGAIIAFLRAQPATGGPAYRLEARALGRLGIVPPPVRIGAPGTPARGEHLALSICTECHGDDLRGSVDTPTLALAATYTPEQFRTLLRTGIPPGGRDLGLMKEMALRRFAHLTDEEIDALHTWLASLAAS